MDEYHGVGVGVAIQIPICINHTYEGPFMLVQLSYGIVIISNKKLCSC